jgi:hypothetical protein
MKKLLLTIITLLSFVSVYGNNKHLLKNANYRVGKLSTSAQDTTSNTGQIPVIGWIGVPEFRCTLDRYQEFKAAGFTASYWPFLNANAVEAALDVAQKAGIKVFIACPELQSNPEAIVKRFMNHPANAGYFVNDEPGLQRFSSLVSLVKRIKSVDSKHICYINLLPNVASAKQMGIGDYQLYLNNYIRHVPSDILSFDHYPVIGNGPESITPQWYKNLEMISKTARDNNKPFWAFALSVAFTPHPIATLGSLKLQVFSDLAYGAQAIQYFTYWTPAIYPGGPNFDNAAISRDGRKTDIYDKIKQVNNEIKNFSNVFLNAKVISVAHTGSVIPPGTRRFSNLPRPIAVLKTGGLGAIVSLLTNNDKTFLVVVNRDFTAPMPLSIKCNAGVNMITKDGSSIAQDQNIHNINIDPGDVAIYSWSNNLN